MLLLDKASSDLYPLVEVAGWWPVHGGLMLRLYPLLRLKLLNLQVLVIQVFSQSFYSFLQARQVLQCLFLLKQISYNA